MARNRGIVKKKIHVGMVGACRQTAINPYVCGHSPNELTAINTSAYGHKFTCVLSCINMHKAMCPSTHGHP
jgi:hypothetical protein